MRIDIITEEIWHFIGSFQQVTEAARGRDAYESWRAGKALFPDSTLQFEEMPFTAPHKLVDFQPGVKIATPTEVLAQGTSKGAQPLHPLAAITVPLPDPTQPTTAPPTGAPRPDAFHQPGFALEFLPPASVAVIIGQRNHLSDQDILIQQDHGAGFTPFSAFDAPLAALLAMSGVLDRLPDHDHPGDVQSIKTLGHAISADAASLAAGNGAVLIRGDAVTGLHLDGVRIDAAPVLDDHLPEVPEPVGLAADATWDALVTAKANAEAAHIAVLGANTLTNEAVLKVSWLDAPVMLVQGDAMVISLISQINVLSDIDTGICNPQAESQSFNLVRTGLSAAPRPAMPEAAQGAFPDSWIITTIEADLVVCNWVSQQNFVIDHDILSVTWSGNSSFLRLGDNTLVNLVQLQQLGQGYDLIVIGGDMISIAMIRQMNVLLDSDWVQTADGSAAISAGGNLLWNSASISGTGLDTMAEMDQTDANLANAVAGGASGAMPIAATHPAFAGSEGLNVLYIKGDYLTLTMIEQTNILGDADQVLGLAGEAAKDGSAGVTIVSGSNALINAAAIETIGMDSDIRVGGDIYTDAVIYQADFIDGNACDPYAAQGTVALASEAVVFLADGMLADDSATPAVLADSTLFCGQSDGVNAILV